MSKLIDATTVANVVLNECITRNRRLKQRGTSRSA